MTLNVNPRCIMKDYTCDDYFYMIIMNFSFTCVVFIIQFISAVHTLCVNTNALCYSVN